jgi:S1-C subfamily serine protease
MERMGRLNQAEVYYGRIGERYEEKHELLGFFHRQAKGGTNARYQKRYEKLLPTVFPDGLQRVDRAALTAAPKDGARVRKRGEGATPPVLKWGDVIVGLDGYRVRSVRELGAVRALDHANAVDLVVWRDQGYQDVALKLWDFDQRFDVADYHPGEVVLVR